MSNQIIRQPYILNRAIGKETSQILLDGDYIIPDAKADMADILRGQASLHLNKVEPAPNRIGFSGKLSMDILYLAKSAEGVGSLPVVANVDDFINLEGVSPSSLAILNSNIAHIEYFVINDRKIGYRAVMDLSLTAIENIEASIVGKIEGLPEAQQKTAALSASQIAEMKRDEFVVKQDFVIPQNLPAIGKLLETSIKIANKDVKVYNGRVGISGDILLSVMYHAEESNSPVEIMDFELPFSGSIDMKNAKENQLAVTKLSVKDSFVQVSEDSGGQNRILQVEVNIAADIRLTEDASIDILEDAYCVDKRLDFEKQPLLISKLICSNKNQFNVKEAVSLEDAPEVLQVLSATGKVILEDTRVIEDKVIAEGIISADILYIAGLDEKPLQNYSAVIPFKQTIETAGTNMDMQAEIEYSLDRTSFGMISGKEIELRFLVNFETAVYENRHVDIINDIQFSQIDREEIAAKPSMVVVTIGKNDSLWSIAKNYNASLSELMEINDIQNHDEVSFGQKLLVVKKAVD